MTLDRFDSPTSVFLNDTFGPPIENLKHPIASRHNSEIDSLATTPRKAEMPTSKRAQVDSNRRYPATSIGKLLYPEKKLDPSSALAEVVSWDKSITVEQHVNHASSPPDSISAWDSSSDDQLDSQLQSQKVFMTRAAAHGVALNPEDLCSTLKHSEGSDESPVLPEREHPGSAGFMEARSLENGRSNDCLEEKPSVLEIHNVAEFTMVPVSPRNDLRNSTTMRWKAKKPWIRTPRSFFGGSDFQPKKLRKQL